MNRYLGSAVLSVGVLAAICGAACSSSSSGGTSGTGATTPVTADQFASQAAAAVCDNVATCCMTAGYAFDANGCKTGQVQAAGEITKGATLDGVSWDAMAAGHCLELIREAAATCAPSADLRAQLDAVCGHGILIGTKPPGAPCTDSAQCAAPAGGTAYCPSQELTGGGGGGVPSGGAAGAPSSPPPPTCQIQMPTPHAASGAPCNSSCQDFGSSSSSSGSSGTCVGAASPGGAGGNGPTATGTCFSSDGLTCDFTTFTCKPLATAGQPCQSGLDCVETASCKSGMCAPKGQAGEACSLSSFGDCATGLVCDPSTQKCAAQKPVGAACAGTSSDECANGRCELGKCVADGQIASPGVCTGGSSTTPLPGSGDTGMGSSGTAGSSGGAPKG